MKKQRYIIKSILITSFLFLSSLAQKSNNKEGTSNFYPLSQNDYWEYLDYEWMGTLWDTICVLIGTDTILSDKLYHRVITSWYVPPGSDTSYQRIDSIGDVYSLNKTSGMEGLVYRLSDTSYTYWSRAGWNARFDTSYISDVFGRQRRILPVLYFFDYDTLLISPIYIDYLCEDIGLLSTDAGEGQGMVLRGCNISGFKYGTIMSTNGNDSNSSVSFYLVQNFPNPFNSSTIIQYELKMQTQVDLSIYDLLGRKVITLISDIRSEGKYHLNWTPANLVSGTYFYRLQTKEYSCVRRMMYLK